MHMMADLSSEKLSLHLSQQCLAVGLVVLCQPGIGAETHAYARAWDDS